MILVVEDDENDEALTLRSLRKNNIRGDFFVVRDGMEALDFLFCKNHYADRDPADLPDLILLDIKMPKMNGLEVLRRLRDDKRTHFLPVVMFTSSKEEQDIIQGYKNGANSYVRKPVEFTEFSAAIRDLGLYWLGLNEPPPFKE